MAVGRAALILLEKFLATEGKRPIMIYCYCMVAYFCHEIAR